MADHSAKGQPQIAPLGARFGAAVIDRIVPGLLVGIWYLLFSRTDLALFASLLCGFLLIGWLIWQWWNYAIRKAGLGYQLCGLQLVGVKDGKHIGWWRMFIRSLVLNACWALVLPGIALCIFLIIHERRQGWHDMAVGSVTITARHATHRPTSSTGTGATSFAPNPGGDGKRSTAATVALPPHLRGTDPNAKFANVPDAPSPASPISDIPGGRSFAPPQPAPMPQPAQSVYAPPLEPMPGSEEFTVPISHAPIGNLPDWSAQQPAEPSATSPSWTPQAQQPLAQQTPTWQPGGPAGHAQAPSSQPQGHATGPAPVASPLPGETPAVGKTVRVKGRTSEDIPSNDYEGTRLVKPGAVNRPASEGWHVRLDNGTDMPVRSVLLIGRRPQPNQNDQDVDVMPVGDPDSSVSKTHLMVFVDERGCFVTDRGSTNGTALMTQGGELVPCEPHDEVRVQEGQVVSFGERSLRVLRHPAAP